jgi:hypothetical protein
MRVQAARLVMRPYWVLCDRSAAWLHGVDTFHYHELGILPPLETFVLRDRSRVRRDGFVGGERDLSARDLVVVDGVQVTTPLRTALDLGCRRGSREGLAVLDGFIRVHGLSQATYYAELERFRGRRGVVQLRRLVAIADGSAESPGESWTRMAIAEAGLPPPALQYWVRDRGVNRYRVDMAYPYHRVCVEYDGREFHETDAAQAHDRERRRWLRENGWIVIVVTKHDFDAIAINRWTDEIRSNDWRVGANDWRVGANDWRVGG